MNEGNAKTIQEMILDQVQENRKAIGDLHLKLDTKIDIVHVRINKEAETVDERIKPVELEQVRQREKMKRVASTCRWLLWAVTSIALMILGTLAGVIFGNGGGL